MSLMSYIAPSKRRALGSQFLCSVIGVHFCSVRTRPPNSGLNTLQKHRFGRQSSLSRVSLGIATETTEIGGCCRCLKNPGCRRSKRPGWKKSWTHDPAKAPQVIKIVDALEGCATERDAVRMGKT